MVSGRITFIVACLLFALLHCAHGANDAVATVPSAPTAASVSVLGSSELELTFEPPLSDGGAEVTSYQVDWDTEPGMYEVQTISTESWIGPNEVQTVTTKAEHRDEVQVVRTTATDYDEIQIIKTSANNDNKLGGWFTLQYDDTDRGGAPSVMSRVGNRTVVQSRMLNEKQNAMFENVAHTNAR